MFRKEHPATQQSDGSTMEVLANITPARSIPNVVIARSLRSELNIVVEKVHTQ